MSNVNTTSTVTRPDEQGSIAIQGHVKITDPVSKDVLLNTRA